MPKPILPLPMGRQVRDLSGRTFGGWTVDRFAGYRVTASGKAPCWLCRCECGTTRAVRAGDLTSGASTSCGCRKDRATADRRTTHGNTRGGVASREWRSWVAMRQRCTSRGSPSFRHYGGRGITVCDRWRDSFANFLADMGPAPGPNPSLDRIDPNGNYEPGNCRWIPRDEQPRNRRCSRNITYDGVTMTAAEWARRLGCQSNAIYARLNMGWSHREIIETPVKFGNRYRHKIN